jgi:ankyrin repeat protein
VNQLSAYYWNMELILTVKLGSRIGVQFDHLLSHALCISCKKYNASIVGKLLSYGGRVSVVDSNGNSPLHLAISACCQTKLSSAGNRSTEVIDLLLSKSTSETLNIVNADGETPLCLAVRNGLHDVTVKLLERGADVNATSSDKHPLVIACQVSNVVYGNDNFHGPSERKFANRKNMVELLLMHNATVNVETRDGRTPLFMAVENDHDDVVDLLLKYGAKPEPFLSSKKLQVDLPLNSFLVT